MAGVHLKMNYDVLKPGDLSFYIKLLPPPLQLKKIQFYFVLLLTLHMQWNFVSIYRLVFVISLGSVSIYVTRQNGIDPSPHIDDIMQDCCISMANALEILQSCTKSSFIILPHHCIFQMELCIHWNVHAHGGRWDLQGCIWCGSYSALYFPDWSTTWGDFFMLIKI